MLGKLLKYDLKRMYKILVIFYFITLLSSVITRFFLDIKDSLALNITGQIFSGITISAMVSVVINNLMRMWVVFKLNFYGDESYLTHTLPVNKVTLYLSKFLTAVITTFTSVLVIMAGILLAGYMDISEVKEVLSVFADIYDSTVITLLIFIFLIYFMEFMATLLSGYTGIIMGHRSSNMKIGNSVIWGVVFYLISQGIVLLSIYAVGLFDSNIMQVFTTNIVSIDILKKFFVIALVIYALIVVGLGFVDIKLLKKGVNVD